MDSQILYLKHLTHLNLSDNSITTIPKPLGELHLIDVNLSGNVLGSEIEGCDWKWLEGIGVTKSLITLDLSNNYVSGNCDPEKMILLKFSFPAEELPTKSY